MIPDKNFQRQIEQINNMNQRTLKDMFRNEIRGSFLIDIKCRVQAIIAPVIFQLYDFNFTEEKMLTGSDNCIEYEICKAVIGVHHANTIFLTKEERSTKEKNAEYKEQITKQVAENILLRQYAGAFFRSKSFILGERYIYYPVPYLLFVLCTRMNEIFQQYGGRNESAFWLSLIMNKSMAALTLLEDHFLDSAYMPCRTVIEMFVKLTLFRKHPQLFAIGKLFANYDLDKTCCSQEYNEEFNAAFAKRKHTKATKLEFMHYGFVEYIDDYFNIVKQTPYSINGILQYLLHDVDDESVALFEQLKRLYIMCHGYIHGNVITAKYPLLHYFEISLILGEIILRCYKMLCEDIGIASTIVEFDILGRFDAEFSLLKQQYDARSTENFEIEQSKQ